MRVGWEALERELRKFIAGLRQWDRSEFPDLDPRAQVPFVRVLLAEGAKTRELTDGESKLLIGLALDIVERLRQEIRKRGFWKDQNAREVLTRRIVQDLDAARKVIPGNCCNCRQTSLNTCSSMMAVFM